MKGTKHAAICVLATVTSIASAAGAQDTTSSPMAQKVNFHIEQQPVGEALTELGQQSGLTIIVASAIGREVSSFALDGLYTPDEALHQILAPTGLRAKYIDQKTVAVVASTPSAAEKPLPLMRMASGGSTSDVPESPSGPSNSEQPGVSAESTSTNPRDNTRHKSIDEVVVTGTHIPGLAESISPVQVYSRDDIDQSGAGSVAEFVQRLPQNFGDVTPNTILGVTGNSQSQNAVGGSGVNLRGLGSDATLVLINGRRLAPGNFLGNFTDVSLIPLSAIERVEVMPEGASAIYGSDAIGGVVNFIMRRDFEGAETRARYGTVQDGGHHETTLGQTLGHRWERGHALLSYEYSDSTPLSAADRSYSQTALQPFNLVPEQVRHSLFLTADQDIGAGVGLFGDGSFSHRSTYFDSSLAGVFAQHNPARINSYSGTIGIRVDLMKQSELEVSTSYATSETKLQTILVPEEILKFNSSTRSTTYSFDAKLDGTLWNTGAGPIRFAVGAQDRRESFGYSEIEAIPPVGINASRNIIAGFIELRIPLIGAGNLAASGSRLELSLADRQDHYGDFGSSNNPEIGLLWRPLAPLKLHASFGRSFKAPFLHDLYAPAALDLVLPNPDPRGGTSSCDPLGPGNTCTNVLVADGGNPGLKAQRAKTWIIGIDVQPEDVPTLQASATYFHTNFDARIANPSSLITDLTNVLASEGTLGSQIVQRNPPPSLLRAYETNPVFSNPFNIDLSSVSVFVDSRVQNLSVVGTSGVDFSASYTIQTAIGQLATGIDATYILAFENQLSSTLPTVSFLNTPYNPVDLKGRTHVAFTRGGLTSAVLVNYINHYRDNRGATGIPIASWTTVDATIGYQIGESGGVFNNSSIMFAVTNIANRDPPFVANSFAFPVYFDGANANALGRLFSIQLSKRL